MDKTIDYSRFTGRADRADEASRQTTNAREPRSQPERERAPDYYQRTVEREGRSEWSGGSWGGGTWAGRSR